MPISQQVIDESVDRIKYNEAGNAQQHRNRDGSFAPYNDPVADGHPLTVGYGTNLDPKQNPNAAAELKQVGLDYAQVVAQKQFVTEKLAAQLLSNRISAVGEQLAAAYPGFGSFGTWRQVALIDMAYNMGTPRLSGFTSMNAAITSSPPDWATAAYEALDSAWANQVGNWAGLGARALRDAQMLATNQSVDKTATPAAIKNPKTGTPPPTRSRPTPTPAPTTSPKPAPPPHDAPRDVGPIPTPTENPPPPPPPPPDKTDTPPTVPTPTPNPSEQPQTQPQDNSDDMEPDEMPPLDVPIRRPGFGDSWGVTLAPNRKPMSVDTPTPSDTGSQSEGDDSTTNKTGSDEPVPDVHDSPSDTEGPDTEGPDTEGPDKEAPEHEAPEHEAPEHEAPEHEAPEHEGGRES